jgi:hypothetical protein
MTRTQWDEPIKHKKTLSVEEIWAIDSERRATNEVGKEIIRMRLATLEQNKDQLSEEEYEDEKTKLESGRY